MEDLENYRIECATELELPQQKVEEIKNFQYSNDIETKCYLNCSLTKAGIFHPATGFNVDNAVKQLSNNQKDDISLIREQVAECFDENLEDSDVCEWAFRGATCMVKSSLNVIKQSLGSQKKRLHDEDYPH